MTCVEKCSGRSRRYTRAAHRCEWMLTENALTQYLDVACRPQDSSPVSLCQSTEVSDSAYAVVCGALELTSNQAEQDTLDVPEPPPIPAPDESIIRLPRYLAQRLFVCDRITFGLDWR